MIRKAGPTDDCDMLIEVQREALGRSTSRSPPTWSILMVGMEAREDCGRGGAPGEHQPGQGRLVHREPPQARPGGDHHRRRLHRRHLRGAQGHPRHRGAGPGRRRAHPRARSPRARSTIDAVFAEVDEERCSGLPRSATSCAPTAPSSSTPETQAQPRDQRRCARPAERCVAACPSGAIKGRHFTDQQIFAQIEGVLA